MPLKPKIIIRKFTYPNGTKAWRVSGTIEGKQVRKTCKSRTAAMQAKQEFTADLLNGTTDGRAVWTTLTGEQNKDAVAAVSMLKAAKIDKPLSFAVDYFIRHYSPAAEEMTVEQAVTAYMHHKNLEESRGIISRRQHKSIRIEMNGLKAHFPERLLEDITPQDIEGYLNSRRNGNNSDGNGFSMKTWNNRRGLLRTFFGFAADKKWVGLNPVEEIQIFKIKHRRGTAETLSAKEADNLMRFLEIYTGPEYKHKHRTPSEPGFLVPFFALALFAGIRPDWHDGEISKLRPVNIDFKKGVIRIEPEISKINERRIIQIQPNLRAWLKKYPLPDQGAVPRGNANRIITDVRKRMDLGHDVLRHTYISMHVGAFKSVGDAALQAGNSEAVIRRHYLDLKTEEEAKAFWEIRPVG